MATTTKAALPEALPRLETERLLLRPRGLQDLDALLAMNTDPEVTKFIFDHDDSDARTKRDELRQAIEAGFPPGLGYWCAFAKDDPDRFLGWACLLPLPGHPQIEVGYRFTRAAWGNGYATEAARACIRHAFQTVGLSEIAAVVHPENLASQQVLAKLGLVPAGRRRAYDRDLLFYRLEAPGSETT